LGGAYGSLGEDEKCIQNFSRNSLKGREHLGHMSIRYRIYIGIDIQLITEFVYIEPDVRRDYHADKAART
jgi:hypothetical protein